MYFEFDLKSFVEAWRDYQDNQFLGMSSDSYQDMYNHHGVDGGYSHGLAQNDFLREYLCGRDDQHKLILSLLNPLEPSDFYNVIKQGLKFSPEVSLNFNEFDRVGLDVGYQDEDINFEAKREFYLDDDDQLCVEHDKMHVLNAVNQPMNFGIGSRFLNNSFHLYDRLKVKKIIIPSPQQNGIHAWLKMGFVLPKKNWDIDLSERFDAVLDNLENEQMIPASLARKIRHVADINGRYVLNAVARSDRYISTGMAKEQHLVNTIINEMMNDSALMETEFGCGYEADLTSKVQRKRFNNYFADRNLKTLPPLRKTKRGGASGADLKP